MRFEVQGRVQGVFFRASTRDEAVRLNLNGWVRNLPDGRVEVVAEGDRPSLRQLTEWCRQGPPHAKVAGLDHGEEPYRGEFKTFEVRY